jgi:hypothetical protein
MNVFMAYWAYTSLRSTKTFANRNAVVVARLRRKEHWQSQWHPQYASNRAGTARVAIMLVSMRASASAELRSERLAYVWPRLSETRMLVRAELVVKLRP